MCVNYENPKMKQSETANQLGMSSSTSQKNRNDKNMLSPYRIYSNNTNKRTKKVQNTDFDNKLHHETNVKRLQVTLETIRVNTLY